MVKKVVLGTALSAGALYLVFGTSAPSYVQTAFHRFRHSVRHNEPIPFQIDRARLEIAKLEPASIENREALARAEVDVEHLSREIQVTEANLAVEKQRLLTMAEGLRKGEYRLAGRHASYTPEEIKAELTRRYDHYHAATNILEEKRATLKAREQAVVAGREKLADLAAAKQTLMTKLEAIEAQLQAIEATQGKNEFNFDDSALARAKETVAELEKRLEVKARVAEMEGRYSGGTTLPSLEPGRDVLKEVDAEFGAPAKGGDGKTDKSL